MYGGPGINWILILYCGQRVQTVFDLIVEGGYPGARRSKAGREWFGSKIDGGEDDFDMIKGGIASEGK